jgi:hypothetical protein
MWVFEATFPGATTNAMSTIAATPPTNNGLRSADPAVAFGSWINRDIAVLSVREIAACSVGSRRAARFKTLVPVVPVGGSG